MSLICSVDQARSLASHMHNDKDFFQYYALDFQEEATAFHGSESLAQAAFTNAALSKIAELHGTGNFISMVSYCSADVFV